MSVLVIAEHDHASIKAAGLRFAMPGNEEHFTSRPYVPQVGAAE